MEDDPNRDRRDQARWIILLATLAGAMYLCWLMLKPFIGVLLWAAVLTMSFEPVHRRLLERTKSPNLSAGLACTLVVLAIGVPAGLLTWAIIHELTPALSGVEAGITDLLNPSSPITGPAIEWLDDHVDIEQVRVQASEQLGNIGTALASRTLGIVGGVLGALIQFLFIIFVMYYLFRDGKQVRSALSSAIPLRHRQTYAIFIRTREVVSASVYGVLVISVIQGALGGLAFWALGLPSAVLWSVAMMFLSLIPLTGAFVVWIPAAIFLAASGAWVKAILLTLWGILVIGLVDNFLRPKLVGERAKLHELFIFFAVLGGLQVFGLLGIVLGPVVLAIALALFDAFRHPDSTASSTMLILPTGASMTPTMLP
jgi:predicted PurR-regulated permease PerM